MPDRATPRASGVAAVTAGAALAIVIIVIAALAGSAARTVAARRASVAGCTSVVTQAIRLNATISAVPADCRGLRPGQLHDAVATAVSQVTDHGRKVLRRHYAAQASVRVAVLAAAAEQEAAAQATGTANGAGSTVVPAGPGGLPIPVGMAALVTWLLAELSGGYLLLGWLRHGGMRRKRTSASGLPPVVLLSHFGLASAGLLVWLGYLITGVAGAAWVAVGLLLPVAGLGMATLVLAIPETGGATRPAAAGPGAAVTVPAVAVPAGGPTTGIATTTRRRPRMPAMIISLHGAFAFITVLLAVLAAIGAAAR